MFSIPFNRLKTPREGDDKTYESPIALPIIKITNTESNQDEQIVVLYRQEVSLCWICNITISHWYKLIWIHTYLYKPFLALCFLGILWYIWAKSVCENVLLYLFVYMWKCEKLNRMYRQQCMILEHIFFLYITGRTRLTFTWGKTRIRWGRVVRLGIWHDQGIPGREHWFDLITKS